MQLLEGQVEALPWIRHHSFAALPAEENEKCNVSTVPQEKAFLNRADLAGPPLFSQSLPTIHKTDRAWATLLSLCQAAVALTYPATQPPAKHINKQHMMPAFINTLVNILAIFSLASASKDLHTTSDATFLPVEIPIDRAFDVQWNPPGHPQLNAWFLDIPYGDRGDDPYAYYDNENDERGGYYTFLPSEEDASHMSFVRKQEDGTYIQVYERVEFLLISDDVLLFNGDPHEGMGFPAGGGYGTLIKGPSIPAGGADGVWDTEALDEHGMSSAKEWLLKNFRENELPVEEPIDIDDIEDVGDVGNNDTTTFTTTNATSDKNNDNNEFIRVCGTVYRNSDAFLLLITVSVIAVIVAIVACVVRRKCRQDPSDLEKSDGKEGSEEGSVAKTCGDDESCSDV